MAKKYGISPSTLSTFLKQKSKIEQNIDADALGPQRKEDKDSRLRGGGQSRLYVVC